MSLPKRRYEYIGCCDGDGEDDDDGEDGKDGGNGKDGENIQS